MTYPPAPPLYLSMPHRWEAVFLVLVGVPTLIGAVWALHRWFTKRDALPLVILLGGLACSILEPLVDVLGLCWYPRGQLVEAYELMGRPIPLFVPVGYTMLQGAFTLLTLQVFRQRGPKSLWVLWIGALLFTVPFEFYAVHTGSYIYYGHQPLRVFGYPLWWAPVNAAVVIALAVAVIAGQSLWRGGRMLGFIPMAVAIDAGINAALAWPVYTVLWSDVPSYVTHAAGVLTYLLATGAVGLLIKFASTIENPQQQPNADSMVGDRQR